MNFDDVSSASGSAFIQDFARGWDSYVDINIQGESLPYHDQFMDLDPNYTDAWGQPLLRLTFDFHENDQKYQRELLKLFCWRGQSRDTSSPMMMRQVIAPGSA